MLKIRNKTSFIISLLTTTLIPIPHSQNSIPMILITSKFLLVINKIFPITLVMFLLKELDVKEMNEWMIHSTAFWSGIGICNVP